MKRILIVIASAMFPVLLYAQEAQSKMNITGGPLVEANYMGFAHKGFDKGKSKMKMGFLAGGFLDIDVAHHFSIQGELSFVYRHSDFYWSNMGGCYSYWGIEIPVYAMYHIIVGNGGQLNLGLGPYTNFGADAKFITSKGQLDLYEKNNESGLAPMKGSDSGFAFKAGYEFSSGLQINVSLKMSVTNVIENSDKVKMFPASVGVSMAYRFGKKKIL